MALGDTDPDGDDPVGDDAGDDAGDEGLAVLPPWAGPSRSGDCAWWPVKNSAIAAAATPRTATAPPVATPAANVCRSRAYSVRRRSRSQAGSVARRAAQLLTGAAAIPSVGNSSNAASSGPLNWLYLVSEPTMPAKPSTASNDSAQFARSASHQRVC